MLLVDRVRKTHRGDRRCGYSQLDMAVLGNSQGPCCNRRNYCSRRLGTYAPRNSPRKFQGAIYSNQDRNIEDLQAVDY